MENSYAMFQIKEILNFQRPFVMIRKLIILSKKKIGALQLIQISFSSNGDWKESIQQRIMLLAPLKFGEWRSVVACVVNIKLIFYGFILL